MTKNYKAVLKSSLVMLVLFAVAGSGVAQAQECIARADDATTARAEGITEAVGGVELLCRSPRDLASAFPDDTTISIELNTQVTNQITSDRIIDSTGDLGPSPTWVEGDRPTPPLGGTDHRRLQGDG